MADSSSCPTSDADPDLPITMDVAGQRLTVFFNTETQLELMLADIRSATRRVWLETYIFLDDRMGCAVAAALKERAAAGVEVRVHYDAVGCLATSTRFFAELAEAGIQLHCFHSAWESLRRFAFFRTYNRRNHRKVLVIDDRVAYFGGMNIVDHAAEWPGNTDTRPPTEIGWRDVHVRLEGPLQRVIAASFDASWHRATSRRRMPRKAAMPLGILLARDRLPHAQQDEWIRFFDSGSGPRSDRAARVFTRLLNVARQRLLCSMAYFLPIGRVRRALFRACKRRVHVCLLLPSISDVPIVQRAMRFFYHVLLRYRCEIYERTGRMLHSKALIVDDQYVLVGSPNFDFRSLWINWEFFAVIRSRRLAAALAQVVQREIEASQRVTHSYWRTQPWWQRWMDRIAWSLRMWL